MAWPARVQAAVVQTDAFTIAIAADRGLPDGRRLCKCGVGRASGNLADQAKCLLLLMAWAWVASLEPARSYLAAAASWSAVPLRKQPRERVPCRLARKSSVLLRTAADIRSVQMSHRPRGEPRPPIAEQGTDIVIYNLTCPEPLSSGPLTAERQVFLGSGAYPCEDCTRHGPD